jgi:predicted nucleotidyltransferase component of viral defense system
VSANVAHSIHQRLLNKAREAGRPFGEVLQHFGLERFLYRLSQSPYRDRFVLKGALLLRVWEGNRARFTRDIDLLGLTANDLDGIAAIMREVCQQEVAAGGLVFDPATVEASHIAEEAMYEGFRVIVRAQLGAARLRLQVDIGFGDAVVPAPTELSYPTLLDLPPALLLAYSKQSAIAEKLSAMLRLGRDNSRMKDYYDIWLLSRHGSFTGATLSEAIRQACVVRGVGLPEEPVGLSAEFALAEGKAAQWRGFVRKSHAADAPTDLDEVVTAMRAFLEPVLAALRASEPFDAAWHAPGPWRSG